MKVVVVYGCWREVEDEVEVVMEDEKVCYGGGSGGYG
jgi:hypothetical protein